MLDSILKFIRRQIENRVKMAAAEESIMIISVLKWTVLAAVTGIIIGLSSGGTLSGTLSALSGHSRGHNTIYLQDFFSP